MGKIILYYKYVDIQYPEQVRKWQHKLCFDLNLKGRVLIAHEGINGTLGGTQESIQAYIDAMSNHPLFGTIDFKVSDGGNDYFPRLRVVVRSEIVSLGVDTNVIRAEKGGKHLTPSQAHELIASKPENLVLLDARNWYESQVGTFEGAITPNTSAFRELPGYIDQNLETFKDKQVLMFCTGGVRCERASAYLKSKDIAQEVYQIEGGIHRYIEQFPQGFFRGKNYVFDGRVTVKANEDVLSSCKCCGIKTDDYTNCINASCNLQFVSCPSCLQQLQNTCSKECLELVSIQQVPIRTKPAKFCNLS